MPVEQSHITPRYAPYRRVDIGISKLLKSLDAGINTMKIFNNFKDIWISLEVFNLLDINNEISYTFVTDIRGWQYGVPNYLTSRRVNLKLLAKF